RLGLLLRRLGLRGRGGGGALPLVGGLVGSASGAPRPDQEDAAEHQEGDDEYGNGEDRVVHQSPCEVPRPAVEKWDASVAPPLVAGRRARSAAGPAWSGAEGVAQTSFADQRPRSGHARGPVRSRGAGW